MPQVHHPSRQPKVAMNYLIHNEADIIATNIRYHASVGISHFVVMDNGSTDGTRDIICALQKEFPITLIDRPQLDYKQSEWKTEMARMSHKHGADWSIASDADEFWLPQHGNIAALLPRFGATCYCKRFNMLPEHQDFCHDKPFYRARYAVKRPMGYSSDAIANEHNVSIMLHRIHGKVVVQNFGLVRVHGGNHRASHLFNPLYKQMLPSMVVLHYPLRGKKRWLATLERRRKLLENGAPKMGNHYRRWVAFLKQQRLDDEIERLAPKQPLLDLLQRIGVIEPFDQLCPDFRLQYDTFVRFVETQC